VFNSPRLLQLSELGSPKLLQKCGIPVIHEMPAVGFPRPFQCPAFVPLHSLFKSGPLADNGVCAGAFARSNPTLVRPNLQLNFIN
jgi:choline dehydrogenase